MVSENSLRELLESVKGRMQFDFYIAVYGTLMSGERNFYRLPKGEVKCIDNVLTDEAIFQMYINPSISTPNKMTPSVSFLQNGHHLHVQIMNVTKAARDKMDDIEGVGENYERVPVMIQKYPNAEIYLKRDTSKGILESPHRLYCPKTNSLKWSSNP